jgi:adenylate kinase
MGLYVILMGVQGAGKGVQASFIRERYGIPHVSTGDLFRAMRNRTDELARKIQDIMAAGELVPDDVTNEVVRDRLSQPDAADGVIFDGYPRSPGQAEWLENYLAEKGERITVVLLLELDLYVAFKRAFGRVSTPDGRVYNIFTDDNDEIDWQYVEHPDNEYPPRVEGTVKATDEALVRRPDDANAGSIIQRIDTYLATTTPLIEYFEGHDLLVRVDAQQPIEAVSADIEKIIERARVS